MDISFANSRVKKLCSSQAALRAHLGDRGARSVAAQLASLRAASCLDELRFLPGRCRERDGRLALRLSDRRRLIFEPTDEPPPTSGDGSLDWIAIQSVRVVAITRKPTTNKKGST
jgi:proteic killer suppression protein